MASSKVMASSSTTSRNSDLSRRASSSSKLLSSISDHHHNNNTKTNKIVIPKHSSMTVDGLLRNHVYSDTPSSETTTLLNAEITLLHPTPATAVTANPIRKTVDDVWNEIVAGNRKECKKEEEAAADMDEMMTLEDFLARAGAVEESELKMPPPLTGSMSTGTERLSGGLFSFDSVPLSPFLSGTPADGSGVVGFGNGVELVGGGGEGEGRRGKRRAAVLEPLDKAAQQRQRRMIKNRESAARSRERKQVTNN